MTTRAFGRLACAAAMIWAGSAQAGSFSGTFTQDQDIAFFKFTTGTGTTFSAQTTSYATGGFDPKLVLFDSSGHFITSLQTNSNFSGFLNDDGDVTADGTVPPGLPTDPNTGASFDSYWVEGSYGYGNLADNTDYYLALILAGNNGPATGYLGDDFAWEGLPGDPASGTPPNANCDPAVPFCSSGETRTGSWALTLAGTVFEAEVPHSEIHTLFPPNGGGGGPTPPPPFVGVPEIDAAAGTGALTLLAGALALAGDRRRRRPD